MRQLPDNPYGLHVEPGWYGVFTRRQAEGAMPNGTRVRKIGTLDGDGHPDGTLDTVLGSMSDPEIWGNTKFYFVEWDPNPKMAIGVVELRLEEVK